MRKDAQDAVYGNKCISKLNGNAKFL